jgi:hypothetical protein
MIVLISDLAVTMNLIAIALLGFFIGALLLSFTWLIFGRFVSLYSTRSQKVLIWMWLLGPWILGLTTMLIFSPLFEQTSVYQWIEGIAHWHHLYVFQLNSWHGVTVILFVVFSLCLIAIKGTHVYRQGNALYTLKHFSTSQHPLSESHKVLIIDSDVPTAFTSGFFSPTCYVSKGLIDKLSLAELDIVIEHELEHARNKDPLFMLLIACLSAYYPKKLALLLTAKYRLMTEHVADQSTVFKYSAQDVAATIVKVVRVQKSSPAKEADAYLSYFGANDITQRIQQLLQPTKKSIPMIVPVIYMLVMLCITVVAVDASHHLVESIFTHS